METIPLAISVLIRKTVQCIFQNNALTMLPSYTSKKRSAIKIVIETLIN